MDTDREVVQHEREARTIAHVDVLELNAAVIWPARRQPEEECESHNAYAIFPSPS